MTSCLLRQILIVPIINEILDGLRNLAVSSQNQQIYNETLSENQVKQNENIGFGLWIKYQPYWVDNQIFNDFENIIIERQFNKTEHLASNFGGYHIFSLSNLVKEKKLIVVVANYNEQLQTISHKIYYQFDSQVNFIEFFFGKLNYEGNWLMLFIYFNNLNKKTKFTFSNINSDLYYEQIEIDNVPLFDKIIQNQLGGTNYITLNTQSKQFFDQFKGKIVNLFKSQDNILKSEVQTWFSDSIDGWCYFQIYQTFLLTIQFQNFEDYYQTQQLEYPRYSISGWVKLSYQFSNYLETLLIRVTENQDYTDDQKIGDRTLYIKYYQGEPLKNNGFEIITYSYDFPIIQSYQTKQQDKIQVFGSQYASLIPNWHYIQYEIGTERNNQQPIYQVYFSEQQQIQTFTWDQEIYHFTGTKLYIYIGSDKYQQNKFYGQIENLQFNVYCPIMSVEVKLECHYSCYQCDGPSESNCLSCSASSLRIYIPAAKKCVCNGNYLDINQAKCEPILNEFSQIQIIEEQLNCQFIGYDMCTEAQVQCSFGYFKYQNQCIQCPGFSSISKTSILCIECILYPENFYQNLFCISDFMTYDLNEIQAFYEFERPLQNQELFKINSDYEGNYYLTLEVGFKNRLQCKTGYYISQEKCFQCIEGCQNCNSKDICIECEQQYILTYELHCQKVTQCDTFQIIKQKLVCTSCYPKQYILDDTCVNCGLYCAACDSQGFCNYCIDDNKYHLTLDGINCQICSINNCKYCYQYFIFNNQVYTTLDINFYVIDFSEYSFQTGCALCEENYYFDQDQNICMLKCTWLSNTQEFNQCQIQQNDCNQGLILNQNVICLIGLSSNIAIQSKNCQNIAHCSECIENYQKDKSFCIICNEGYYSNILIGQCQNCLIGCSTCFQQNIQYNDYWKWNIKAFYKVMFNQDDNHPFETYSSQTKINAIEIICISCFDGYILNGKICVQGCSPKCQKWGFNNQEVVCVQCTQTQNGYLKTMTQDQYCFDCPLNCAACYERTFEEINEINSQYLINFLNAKYTRKCYEKYDKNQQNLATYINQKFQTVTQCLQFQKCKLKVLIKYYLYCDYFQAQVLNIPPNQLLDIYLIFSIMDTQNHETLKFYEYLNEQSIEEVDIQYVVLKSLDSCQLSRNINAITYLRQNVFTLQQVNVEFIGYEQGNILFVSKSISFTNFNNIKFTNITLQFLGNQNYVIQIYNLEPKITLQFENSIITSQNQSVQLQFTSNFPYFIHFNNLTIKEFILDQQSVLFNIQFSKTQNNKIVDCQNLTIQDSIFYNSQIFLITVFEQQSDFQMQNIYIINSQFQNSSFVINQDSGTSQEVQVVFKNFIIYESQINNSLFQILQNTFRAIFLNVDIENTNFYNSNFMFSLIFTIANATFNNLVLNNSLLICNLQNLLDIKTFYNDTPSLEITNTSFLNIFYNKNQSLISILNSNFIKKVNIKINTIIIQNVQPMPDADFVFFNNISYYEAQIFLQCQICTIQNIQLIRSTGLPDIAILNSDQLNISNVNIILSQEYYQSTLFSYFNQQLDYNFAIYIGYYTNIQIDSLIITKCIIFDSSLIIFQGQDLFQKIQKEEILIKNSIIQNNMLIVSKQNSQTAIISIYSEQSSNLTVQNVTFSYNSLNQYYQDFNKISSTTMILKLYQGSVNIVESNFIQNLVMNSTNSILNIQCQDLKLTNSLFFQNNIFNTSTICDNLDQSLQFLKLTGLKKIFPIKSECGNGKFVVSSLYFDNIMVNISIGLQVGGFYIILQGISEIQILNSYFYKTMNTQQQGVGGSFNIDSSESQLNLIVSNCIFSNAISQSKGGAFYISPSQSHNYLIFSNLTINDCFSLQGSFLWFSVNDSWNPVANIQFFNSKISFTEAGFHFYLLKSQGYTAEEISLIILQNSLITILNGESILIKQIEFSSVFNQILFDISVTKSLVIQNLFVDQGNIFLTPLFRIQLAQYNNVDVQITDLHISSIEQFVYQADFCIMVSSPISTMPNQNICSFPLSEQQLINDYDDFEAQNILNCKLKSIFDLQKNATNNLFEISNFNINHHIYIYNFTMNKIICQNCQYGIFTIKAEYFFFVQVNLIIRNIQIQDSICGNLGCLSIINSIDVTTVLPEYISELRNLQTINLLTNDCGCQMQLENSLFQNNTAVYGGSLFVLNVALFIKSCKFYNNSAKLGGGMYFFAASFQLQIIETLFINNMAEIGGGIFLYNQTSQFWKKLYVDFIDNNSSFSSNNVQEIPKSLTISLDRGLTILNKQVIYQSDTQIVEKINILPYRSLGSQELQYFILLPSGTPISQYTYFDQQQQKSIPYNLTLRIIALNSFGEQERYLDSSYCTIETKIFNSTSKFELEQNYACNLSKNNISFDSTTGDYNLDDLIIYFNPYNQNEVIIQFSIRCNQIQIPIYSTIWPYQIIYTITDYQLIFEVKTFPCQTGEFLNSTSGACIRCDTIQNQYQVVPNATSCIYKDDVKINKISYSMIELRSSFWRAQYDSTVIESCYHFPSNCIGGWYPGDQSCFIGHVGALCEQCDLYNTRQSDNYFRSGLYNCSSCNKTIENLLTVVFISLWALISIFLSVSSTVEMIDSFIIDYRLRMLRIFSLTQENSTAILIKAFTNYLQIISTIASFQLQLPEGLSIVSDGLGNPIQSMSFSFDCYLISISNIEIIYLRIIWSLIMSLFYQGIFFGIGMLLAIMGMIKFRISYATVSVIYMFIYFQPNFVGSLISLFSFRIISEIKWVQGTVAYKYDTQRHTAWLISFCLPLLLLFCIVVPLFLWYGVHKNKDKLQQPKVRQIWGYLYNEYIQTAYFWETIKIVQKQIIIIVLAYYDDHIPIKASLVFLVLFGYSYYSTTIKPYRTKQLNAIDAQITVVCAISIILGSSIYTAQQSNITEIVWPFYIVIGLLNGVLICTLIVKILFAYFKKLNKFLELFKELLFKFVPHFITKHPFLYQILRDKTKQTQLNKEKFQKIRQLLLPKIKSILEYKKTIMNLPKTAKLENSLKMLLNQLQSKDPLQNEQIFTNRIGQSSNLSLIRCSSNAQNFQQDSIFEEKLNSSVC